MENRLPVECDAVIISAIGNPFEISLRKNIERDSCAASFRIAVSIDTAIQRKLIRCIISIYFERPATSAS